MSGFSPPLLDALGSDNIIRSQATSGPGKCFGTTMYADRCPRHERVSTGMCMVFYFGRIALY